jgi:hypothetical protein
MKPQHYNVLNEKEKLSKRVYVRETQSVKKKKRTHCGTVCRQILLNAKLQTGKRGQETELTGRSPFGRRRSVELSKMKKKIQRVVFSFHRMGICQRMRKLSCW